jgi:hypothetical protein
MSKNHSKMRTAFAVVAGSSIAIAGNVLAVASVTNPITAGVAILAAVGADTLGYKTYKMIK